MALLNDVFEATKVKETFVSATALRSAEESPEKVLILKEQRATRVAVLPT
jgi:hypothetical protein